MSKLTRRFVGIALTLGLLLGIMCLGKINLKKVFAVGINNITVNFTDSTISGSGNIAVSFEIEDTIPVNGKIYLEFPSTFSNLEINSMTGSNLGTSPTFATGETATTILITTGTGGSATGSAVTASGFVLTNPSEEGFYLLQIRTYDENNQLLGMGFKLMEIGNPVNVTTKVEESLIASIDATSKVFTPDPSINSGAVTDQATTLTVRTNADTSYMVTTELINNRLTSSGSQILSQTGADDYFRIGSIELNLESGTGTTIADNSVYSGSTTIFQKNSGVSTNGDLITTHYDLNLSYYKATGTYTGSLLYSIYPTF